MKMAQYYCWWPFLFPPSDSPLSQKGPFFFPRMAPALFIGTIPGKCCMPNGAVAGAAFFEGRVQKSVEEQKK
jgi:hypothetical protein